MRRILSVAVFLSVISFVPLVSQDDEPNYYRVVCVQVLDAQYLLYLQEILIPMYDEFMRMGLVTSYHAMSQVGGAGECDIKVFAEYPRWDAYDDITSAEFDQASQAAHGRPWSEVIRAYDLPALRKLIRTEFYRSRRP